MSLLSALVTVDRISDFLSGLTSFFSLLLHISLGRWVRIFALRLRVIRCWLWGLGAFLVIVLFLSTLQLLTNSLGCEDCRVLDLRDSSEFRVLRTSFEN